MKIVWTLLAVLIVLCTVTFGTLVRSRMIERAFAGIHKDDPVGRVLQLRGTPRMSRPCGPVLDVPGCAQELVYAHPFAPLVPEYWLVALDSHGRVLQTAHTTTY